MVILFQLDYLRDGLGDREIPKLSLCRVVGFGE